MEQKDNPTKTIEQLNAIADRVVECIFSVHRYMGPGFSEGVYQSCLIEEFEQRGISYKSQLVLPVFYKGKELDKFYKLDILAENEIIIELKSATEILPAHKSQLLSYMKMSGKRLGYVANFNVALMKDGLKRMRLDDASEFRARYL